jgi:ABC-2 type transport system ATP-binding protein
MEEAEKLCDRVGIIDHGSMLALDAVDKLIDEHGGDSLLSYSTGEESVTHTTNQPIKDLQGVLSEHADIRDLRLTRPDLEKVFLNLTGRQLRD